MRWLFSAKRDACVSITTFTHSTTFIHAIARMKPERRRIAPVFIRRISPVCSMSGNFTNVSLMTTAEFYTYILCFYLGIKQAKFNYYTSHPHYDGKVQSDVPKCFQCFQSTCPSDNYSPRIWPTNRHMPLFDFVWNHQHELLYKYYSNLYNKQ